MRAHVGRQRRVDRGRIGAQLRRRVGHGSAPKVNLGFLGRRLRGQITWTAARAFDSALGAVFSVLGVLAVAWMVALPLASAPYAQLARSVRESSVVHRLDDVRIEVPLVPRTFYAAGLND